MEKVEAFVEEYLKVFSNPCDVDFTWYNMIRAELLRKTVQQAEGVLDVGCGRGEVLLMLSKQIGWGVGVDISEDDIVTAENTRKKQGIKNVEFRHANALDLPFALSTFDVVLCLGDVFGYFNLNEQHDRVLSEIKRVLKNDGLTVYEGMNWAWEYKVSPYWTCFSRTDDGSFCFGRNKRTASGRETSRTYEVVPETPLHEWILQQDWPVSPQGYNTTLDVVEKKPIPERWLKFQGANSGQYYTSHALKRKYKNNGFRNVKVCAYGQTYDIVNKAGLLETVGQWKPELAKAEAEMIFKLRMGSGPWIFLVARG
ncbi:class I SAM-dependent methyltransferase [bacterium]|nr:class I SAM-dependent methyltransferase [bacterium]